MHSRESFTLIQADDAPMPDFTSGFVDGVKAALSTMTDEDFEEIWYDIHATVNDLELYRANQEFVGSFVHTVAAAAERDQETVERFNQLGQRVVELLDSRMTEHGAPIKDQLAQ